MTISETLYGTALVSEDDVSIVADFAQLYAWSHRPGAAWPCSTLCELDKIEARYDRGGLLELDEYADGMRPVESESSNLAGDELSAWTADVLKLANLPSSHPVYPVAVGQFQEHDED